MLFYELQPVVVWLYIFTPTHAWQTMSPCPTGAGLGHVTHFAQGKVSRREGTEALNMRVWFCLDHVLCTH